MPPKIFERFFKKNLDDNEIFDRTISNEILKIIDKVGVNLPGIHLAYKKAQELNKERKSPHHKHYILNSLQTVALNSMRFIIDSEIDPNLERNVENEIARMRVKD